MTSFSARNAALAAEFLTWMRDTRSRRGVSVYNYGSVLSLLCEWLGETPIERVTTAQLEAFIGRPRRGGRVGAPATRAKDATIIRMWAKFLVDRGHMKRNPAALLGVPTVRNEHPKPISDEHWKELWGSDLTPDERVAWGLGFFLGLRRRELCELRPHHVVVRSTTLMGFPRKGGGDDILPYGDILDVLVERMPQLGADQFAQPFHRWVRERQGAPYVLCWGRQGSQARVVHVLPDGCTDPDAVNRRLRQRCAALKLPHYTPHQLRHSFVTNLLRAGVPLHIVSRLANHANVQTTMRYTKAAGGELREWMRGVNRQE